MSRRLVIIIGCLLAMLVLAEIISLLQLRNSLASNARYWQQRSQETGALLYIALGDSAAQGVGARTPDKGYVGVIAKRLEAKTGQSIRVINLSVSGAKLRDVIDKQIPELKKYNPDFVTVEAGANDIVTYDAQIFAKEFEELAKALPSQTVISNMPNFGGIIRRQEAVKSANESIVTTTRKYNLATADLYTFTKVGDTPLNYAADLFHPNNRGYRNWADAFWVELKDL